MTSASGQIEGTAPITVFVSYSRDDLPLARPLIDALEAEGIKVWWDGLLSGGDAFVQTTEAALETSDVVLVLWSARSVQSHWVRDEATRGRDRGRLVPVSIDGTSSPLGFRQIQYLDLSQWRDNRSSAAFTGLVRAIRDTARAPRSQQAFAAIPQAVTGLSRRAALTAGGGLILAAGAGALAWRSGLFGNAVISNSVAVLPFRNIGGDVSEAYFSDGLAEELRAALSLNRQIEVAAQTSSNTFRGKNADAKDIAAKLGVAFILDGSVRRAEGRLRIAVQLINGATGFEEWNQKFDRISADVFALQEEIATTVADALAVNVGGRTSGGQKRIGGTRNEDALDAYLRGQALYKLGRDEASDRAALTQFDRALALDPRYAAAQAARSRALTVIANTYASGDALKALYDKAIAAAKAAVDLAPELAEGHAALGFALFNGRLDVAAAKVPYGKSFELGFGNADILAAFANFAGRTGMFDAARKAIGRAQKLDPLNAGVFRNAGNIEYAARNYGAALAALRAALSINPDQSGVHVVLGDMHLIGGRIAQAREEYSREANRLTRLRGLAIADMRLGNRVAADAGLAAMIGEFGDNSLYQQTQIFAQWNRHSDALDALERALFVGDSGLVQSRNDPLLDPLRGDARFSSVLRQLGFE